MPVMASRVAPSERNSLPGHLQPDNRAPHEHDPQVAFSKSNRIHTGTAGHQYRLDKYQADNRDDCADD